MDVRKRAILSSLSQVKDIFFEDSEEDEVAFLELISTKNKNKTKRVCVRNYVELTVPNYSFEVFKRHFRLNKTTFEVLLNMLQSKLINEAGRPPVEAKKKLLSVVWLLANQESFRSVADRFDLATSMLHDYLNKICNILAEMASEFIHWPSNLQETVSDFKSVCNFPGVIGAVDGCHIEIKAPQENPGSYYSRKKKFSLILQAVAVRDLTFTHVTCSFPGSVHDARVFANSEINSWFGNPNFFPEHCHLIGDSAYPLKINLMVPYKDNGHLGRRQINYNRKLSQSRVCIERAFGLLKGRFRRLKFFDAKVKYIPLYVLASCVLHNVCIRENDEMDIDDEDSTDDEDDDDDLDNTDDNACNKRDYICGLL